MFSSFSPTKVLLLPKEKSLFKLLLRIYFIAIINGEQRTLFLCREPKLETVEENRKRQTFY